MNQSMSQCDLLDLASIAKVQADGFLVCTHVQKDSLRMRIRNVSSNIGHASFSKLAVRHDPRLFIGSCVPDCFSDLVAQKMSALFQQYLGKKNDKYMRCSFACDISNKEYFMTLIRSREGLIFEIISDDQPSTLDTLSKMTARTESTALFETACSTVTDVAAYDRAMVYQFQEDLSGKVVYEWIRPARRATTDPYLNMYFPASDIPLPARQMFMIRPLRVIFDNDKDPVDVIGHQRDEDIDLSNCALRANHPVHTSYMKNMGVRSSMSIAIVMENELWGLISFQTFSEAVFPRGRDVTFFENLGIHVSTCLSGIQRADSEERRVALSSVIDKGFCTDDASAFFADNALDFLRVMEADSFCIRHVEKIQSFGNADLVLTTDAMENVSRDGVGKDWFIGELRQPSRGFLCAVVHQDLVLVFIRKSKCSDKMWGGDPSHVKIMRPDGVPGPRGSFERYVQSGVDSLNKWNKRDQELATHMSSRLKPLSAKFKFFADKSDRLVQAGQVGYTTLPKRRVLDTTLISHLSHELNTPIHGLSSTLTLLLEDFDMTPSDMREHLLHGLQCIKLVSKAVEGVLAIASGGELSKSSRPDNLEQICLGDFIGKLEKEFDDFTVAINVGKDQGNLVLKSTMLYDTLRAIIQNSVSLGAGSTHMSVSCCSTHREATMAWKDETRAYSHRNIRNAEDTTDISESDTWFTFSVIDSSCGIHRDMLDNVMAYGDHRGTATTAITNSHQGVGLDVYRCISNIFEMNGSIGIASTVSKGTVISVMLPVHATVPKASSPINLSTEDMGTFMVVDDNTVNRKLAARLVRVACTKTLGVAPVIKEFADGRVCLDEVKRMRDNGERVMGILMDHNMPVMSGKEATSRIRETEEYDGLEKVPIFGFTADSTESTRDELIKSGMDDVLSKPLSMKKLEATCLSMMSLMLKKA